MYTGAYDQNGSLVTEKIQITMDKSLEVGYIACRYYYMTGFGNVEMPVKIKISEIKDITVTSTEDNTTTENDSATTEADSTASASDATTATEPESSENTATEVHTTETESEVQSTPETGDSTPLALLLVLTGVSIISFLATAKSIGRK